MPTIDTRIRTKAHIGGCVEAVSCGYGHGRLSPRPVKRHPMNIESSTGGGGGNR
jgi:hypothetical protein